MVVSGEPAPAPRVLAGSDHRLVAVQGGGLGHLQRMLESTPRGGARVWLREWGRLLDGPLVDLLTALTSPAPRSRELRQNSPFAGVLTDTERLAVLVVAREVGRR